MQEDIQKAIANNELYPIGTITFADWKEAFENYLKLAKQGDAKCQFNLGYMYARGDIMERDFGKAFEWYQKAADNGDPRAHFNLAQMYEKGEFVLADSVKAKEHMAKAIELGDDRAKNRAALANAKAALKQGDREQAKALFASVTDGNKEAKMGTIACNAVFKSVYNTLIKYSHHSGGSGKNKRFWKWGESVISEVNLTMTNQSGHSWPVLVKAMIRGEDGKVNISPIGGVLKAGETLSNVINPDDYGKAFICGVTVFSDREGSADKPFFSFYFPDVSIQPDEEERKNLHNKMLAAQEEMMRHNKTAKPGPCFVLTACYGSFDAPTVLAFRQFRDKHLAQYKLGRRFITFYYTHGANWARAIDNKPRLKATFRTVFNQLAKILPK